MSLLMLAAATSSKTIACDRSRCSLPHPVGAEPQVYWATSREHGVAKHCASQFWVLCLRDDVAQSRRPCLTHKGGSQERRALSRGLDDCVKIPKRGDVLTSRRGEERNTRSPCCKLHVIVALVLAGS